MSDRHAQRSSQACAFKWSSGAFQPLEARQLLAVVAWDGGAGDNLWSNPVNWGGNALPGAADTVQIGAGFAEIQYTIAVPAANRTVASLQSASPIRYVTGGEFGVTGTADYNAAVTMAGGQVGPGTFDVRDAGPLGLYSLNVAANVVKGATVFGDMTFAANGWLNIRNGLTLNGRMVLNVNNIRLKFRGDPNTSQSLTTTTTAEVSLSNNSLVADTGHRLVIGAGVTVRGHGGIGGDVTSHGTISADVSGMTLNLSGFLTNNGVVEARNNATLNIGGPNPLPEQGPDPHLGFVGNANTVRVFDNSTVILDGQNFVLNQDIALTGSQFLFIDSSADGWSSTALINMTGGNLSLSGLYDAAAVTAIHRTPSNAGGATLGGTLDLEGGSLTLDDATGSLSQAGSIRNGTLNLTAGFGILTSGTGASLDDVTLNISDPSLLVIGPTYTVSGGFTLNGVVRVGEGSALHVGVAVTTASAGEVLLDSPFSNNPARMTLGPSVTVGAGVTVRGRHGSITGSALINHGLLLADTAGRPMTLAVGNFTNVGTVRASGAAIGTSGTNVTNVVANTLTGGSWENLAGVINIPVTIRTIAAGTNVVWGGTGSFNLAGLSANHGSFTLTDARTLTVTPNGGTLTNNGSLTLHAGTLLNITGHFTQTAAGSLRQTIASESSFGRIAASGAVSLDGGLTVVYDGYVLSRGDAFDLLTGATVTGEFSSVSIGGAQGYDRPFLRYESGRVRLEIIAAGDFDGDGFVTGVDYDLFVQAFENGDVLSDFDGDGFITGLDFDLFVQAFEHG